MDIYFSLKAPILIICCLFFATASANHSKLISTEADPDAYINNCVNVINGDYCESSTDLMITGPDMLTLQRFYSITDAVTGETIGNWRILPQRFLVIGKEFSGESCTIGAEQFDKALALVGERSGGVLPYSGWKNTSGYTKEPLKVDVLKNAIGLVNTYAIEINGQNNHQNNVLHCKGDTCELILGDGTKRLYNIVQDLPSEIFGEELTPLMSNQVRDPEYYLLSQETLPSGNHIFYNYDENGHIICIEMKNKPQNKIFSWIKFEYNFGSQNSQIHITTSDSKNLTYNFVKNYHGNQLLGVKGSHYIPTNYEYENFLTRKILPEGRFTEIEYKNGKVKCLRGPTPVSSEPEIIQSFNYGESFTDVFDAFGTKTRYIYDKKFQLTSIQRYDQKNNLYRTDQKFWGKDITDAGLLLAKTVADGLGRLHSYRCFKYDKSGNVIEEKLYGNLTGKRRGSFTSHKRWKASRTRRRGVSHKNVCIFDRWIQFTN